MWVASDVWAQPPGVVEPVVRGASFAIARGEWLALMGPNGCGKSTLALAAAGLWPVSRGTITAGAEPIEPTAEARARLRIAAVLQEPASQLFERTVRDEIAFAARNLGTGEAELATRVAKWGACLGLDALLERDPHTLSAGWQQRVLIAGALASEPALLVVDEGASHMDAPSRALVLAVIRAAAAGGVSVLWVTQDGDEARAADRVMSLAPAREAAARERQPVGGGGGAPPGVASGRRVVTPPAHGAGEAFVSQVRIGVPSTSEGRHIRVSRPLEFTLAVGRPVALVGANGSGKTVVLEALAGFTRNEQVSVAEDPSAGHGPVLAAQFPELQVFGETVAEELTYGVIARGGDAGDCFKIALQLFAELGLEPEMMRRSTWSLSAGERRLVQVAAALLTPSTRVLIDEPTCGLDRQRSDRLALVLAQFAAIVPIVVATQDPDLPARIGAAVVALGR